MDREWTRVWEEQFQPMKMGTRLWICPSWTPPPDPDAINILLDPGLAFGTGTHPTTAMCFRALMPDCLKDSASLTTDAAPAFWESPPLCWVPSGTRGG